MTQQPVTDTPLRYRGVRRDGTAVTGSTTPPVAEFVERQYLNGWQSLIVFDARTDAYTGGIARHLDTGRRTWWAERPRT